jgi:hypothetical protein
VCEAAWTTPVLFSGRVVSVEPLGTPKGIRGSLLQNRVRFAVLEAFRGVAGAEVEIQTGAGGGDCGYRFREGMEYLVFAHGNDAGGKLTVTSCSRTRALSSAGADLEYARAAFNTKVPLGRVSGSLTLDDKVGSGTRGMPASQVPIVIERDGLRISAKTDTGGRFAVDGLAPGLYTIRAELPDTQYASMWPNPVELKDVRGCAETTGTISYDGRLLGRVTDAGGAPVPGLTVDLTLPPRPGEQRVYPTASAITDEDGRYEIHRLGPGSYILGINTRAQDGTGGRFPQVFHPGTQQLERAGRVSIGRGQRKLLEDFVLPATLHPVSISGVVLSADGVPVAGARVYLKGPSEVDYILGEPFVTDASGRFRVAAFDGHQYRIFAESTPAGTRQTQSAEPQLLTAADKLPPVTLTLRARY